MRLRQLNGNPLGGSRTEVRLVLEPWFLVLARSNAVPLRMNESSVVWKLVVLDVIPVNAFAIQRIPKLVVRGVIPVSVVPPNAAARVGLDAGDS